MRQIMRLVSENQIKASIKTTRVSSCVGIGAGQTGKTRIEDRDNFRLPLPLVSLRAKQHQQRTFVVRPDTRKALGGNGTERSRRNRSAGEREVVEGNGRGASMRGHQRMQPTIMIEQQRRTGE